MSLFFFILIATFFLLDLSYLKIFFDKLKLSFHYFNNIKAIKKKKEKNVAKSYTFCFQGFLLFNSLFTKIFRSENKIVSYIFIIIVIVTFLYFIIVITFKLF